MEEPGETGHSYPSNYADECKIAESKPLAQTRWKMENLSYHFYEPNSEQCFDLNCTVKLPFDNLKNICMLLLMEGLYSAKSIRQKNFEKALKRGHETLKTYAL